jgi:tetratricopeptide (TPR) repeat protein
MADGNPEKLLKEARSKLNSAGSRWNPFANKADAAEEAANLLDEAATSFKAAGNLQRAAETYEEASAVFENEVKDKIGAARSIGEAVNLYRTINQEAAIRCMERAVGLYRSAGNFRRGCTFYEQLGAMHEERGELPQAKENYLNAGRGYTVENQTATANKSYDKAGEITALIASKPEEFHEARDLFLDVARSNMQNRTLRFNVKNYLFKAGRK